MNPFNINLQRHIAEQGKAIGGERGRAAEMLHGWHPFPTLVFFDDYTSVAENDPDTNFYASGRQLIASDDSSAGKQRVILKCASIFSNPRCINLAESLAAASALFTGDMSEPPINLDVGISATISLVKWNLAVGETNGIDGLTWNILDGLMGNTDGPISYLSGDSPMSSDVSLHHLGLQVRPRQVGQEGGRILTGTEIDSLTSGATYYGLIFECSVSMSGSTGAVSGSVAVPALDQSSRGPRPFVAQDDFDIIWPL